MNESNLTFYNTEIYSGMPEKNIKCGIDEEILRSHGYSGKTHEFSETRAT